MQATQNSLLQRCKKIPPHGWILLGFTFLMICQWLLFTGHLQKDDIQQKAIDRRIKMVEIQKALAVSFGDLALYSRYKNLEPTQENKNRKKKIEAKLEKDFDELLETTIKGNKDKRLDQLISLVSWIKLRWLQLIEEQDRTDEEEQKFMQKLSEVNPFLLMPVVDEEQGSSIYSILILQKLYRLGELQLFLNEQKQQKETFEKEHLFDLSLLKKGVGDKKNRDEAASSGYIISNYGITQYLLQHTTEIELLLQRLFKTADSEEEAIDSKNFNLARQILEEFNKTVLVTQEYSEEDLKELTYLWIFYLDRLQEALKRHSEILLKNKKFYFSFYLLFCLLGVTFICYGMYQSANSTSQIIRFKQRLLLATPELKEDGEQIQSCCNDHFFSKVAEDLQKIKRSCDDKTLLITSGVKEMLYQSKGQEEIASKQEKISKVLTLKCTTITDSNRVLFHSISNNKLLIEKAFKLCEQGTERLIALENVMQQLIGNTSLLQEILKKLSSQVEGISALMNTMVSVTDQTHLLALNTSLESARVKEGGKGIEVIAKQIDRLADQTAQAALTVEYLIQKMCRLMEQNENKVQDISSKVVESVESSSHIRKNFRKIGDKVKLLQEEFEDLLLITEEQWLQICEIQQTIQGLQTLPLSMLSQRDQLTTLAEELAKSAASTVTPDCDLISLS